ncbi:MAG: Sb-PDE family phosphodiesterase [Planctomycetales bacterium]|nr:Sb-PDE family phosphodiesterase [Planctomycetales bacterium]
MTAKRTRGGVFLLLGLIVLDVAFSFPERYFPNIPGYQTLVCDFHTHTVFSDGLVWPTVRIHEAVREKLDVIAITDHIEYQPYRQDIPTNHGRPYQIAQPVAQEKGILLIQGAEITRDTPPGHYNALFLTDIARLETELFLDAIRNANTQQGFVFWNHHTWHGAERGQWEDVQTQMYDKGWLHGMEVANSGEYYPQAHQWCLEKKLAMLGNSDIHDPSYFSPFSAHQHRTVTLVFAAEKSVSAVKQALVEGRTAVWYKNQLIGRKEFLLPLFEECVKVDEPRLTDKNTLALMIRNNAMIDLEFEAAGLNGPITLTVPAFSAATTEIPLAPQQDSVTVNYEVKNFLVQPEQGLTGQATFSVPLP